jgi:hypothetical protein
LGFAGINGIAVGLDTYPSDFVGIADGSTNGSTPNWVAQNSVVPQLRVGSHMVDLTYGSGTLTVSMDGQQLLSQAMSLPPQVLVGFTGGDGALTDAHDVSDVTITTDDGTQPAVLPEFNTPVLAAGGAGVLFAAVAWIESRRRRRVAA